MSRGGRRHISDALRRVLSSLYHFDGLLSCVTIVLRGGAYHGDLSATLCFLSISLQAILTITQTNMHALHITNGIYLWHTNGNWFFRLWNYYIHKKLLSPCCNVISVSDESDPRLMLIEIVQNYNRSTPPKNIRQYMLFFTEQYPWYDNSLTNIGNKQSCYKSDHQ